MVELKAFDRWSTSGIVVEDIGLKPYIVLDQKIVPKTYGRNVGTKFHKSKNSILERFMNKMLVPGHRAKKHFKSTSKVTGKVSTVYNIMEKTLALIEERTKENPIGVLVKAIENAAPREEIVAIEYGGARYPKSVECSPQRRVDITMRLMTQGAYQKSFNSKKSIQECLAEEIINAYKMSQNSAAISKKLELERQADSAR